MAAREQVLGQEWRLDSLLTEHASNAISEKPHVTGICADSRKVVPGDLFVVRRGSVHDGAEYVTNALEQGAVAVVAQTGANLSVPVPYVEVDDLDATLGLIADKFFHHPSRDLFTVGVTGTNGKTSCVHYIAQALSAPCGVIGTLGYGVYGDFTPSDNTTPEPITLQRSLADFRNTGCQAAVIEVSSHAIVQHRVVGVEFDVALFTNLSHDHLDYHSDLNSYSQIKQQLFTLPSLGYGVVNIDDLCGCEIFAALSAEVTAIAYTLSTGDTPRPSGTLIGNITHSDAQGMTLEVNGPWGSGKIRSSLIGKFNAYNLLASLGVLVAADIEFNDALQRLSKVRSVAGRMERFATSTGRCVVVDYAHTPAALEAALCALRPLCKGTLWCVFGCGGDRDKSKRQSMGEVADRFAERVIITDDNPRWEDPKAIVDDIKLGAARAAVVHNRRDAIEQTIGAAGPNDIVLIAGKGHEDYQDIAGEKRFLSDRALVTETLGLDR